MKKIQVAFLMEETGLYRDTFYALEEPEQYFNRSTYTGEWFYACQRGNYCENDYRVSPNIIFEVIAHGEVYCLDGNGDFEGKVPFLPFETFRKRLAHSLFCAHPDLKGYETMKAKLLSLPGGEQYADPHSCRDNWLYALNFGCEVETVVDTAVWLNHPYNILAVQYTHTPTGFSFINYCFRLASQSDRAFSHDLLLYSWED